VLLSGLRDFETVVDAINVAQVGRVVPKPWEEEALIGALRDVVELRRLQIENQQLADQVRVQQGLLSKHEAELRRIESMWPGITKVEWGADGSITITEKHPA
jgi:DNA-binding NtrC family response regulator